MVRTRHVLLRIQHTFPSVTVRSVSMTLNLVSKLGVSSRKPMTTWTILVMACLSCPCFLLNSCTCSFSNDQSLEFFDIVTMATRRRDVDGRSDDCRVCFSRLSSLSTACCVCPFYCGVSIAICALIYAIFSLVRSSQPLGWRHRLPWCSLGRLL